jgi:hypothetical protein
MPKDHFIPQHYLRHFGVCEKFINAIKVEPYEFCGQVPIRNHCQEENFYEGDEKLNLLLWQSENDLAPVLRRVVANKNYSVQELIALKFLVALFSARTRKSAELAKVFPKFMAERVINAAIARGDLPPCPDGPFTEDMMDFRKVSGFLVKQSYRAWLEMHTLECKLLDAPPNVEFVTSDSPVNLLNQFCVGAHPLRSYAGFGQTGVQVILPLSSNLCLFLFDPGIYKVGNRRDRLVSLKHEDVDILNSLQFQSAEKCVYFRDARLEPRLKKVVGNQSGLRVRVRDSLKVYPTQDSNTQLLHLKRPVPVLPRPWNFCRVRRHTRSKCGEYRHANWSAVCEEVVKDIDERPSNESLLERHERAINRLFPPA